MTLTQVSIIFALLLWGNAFAARAEIFTKTGNNGRSCDEFCANPEWGARGGRCLYGIRLDNGGQRISCEESSEPGSANITCACVGANKNGNNGTVSCRSWCGSADEHGPASTCIAAFATSDRRVHSCDDVPGLQTDGQLQCSCDDNLVGIRDQLRVRQGQLHQEISQKDGEVQALIDQQSHLSAQIVGAQDGLRKGTEDRDRQRADLLTAESHLADLSQKVGNAQTLAQTNMAEAAAAQAIRDQAQAQLDLAQLDKETHERQLNVANNKHADIKAQVDAATSALGEQQQALVEVTTLAQSAPKLVQHLLAQNGQLSGAGRQCSATMVAADAVRSAWHCVDGLAGDAMASLRFSAGDGSSTPIAGIKLSDPDHDAVILTLASTRPYISLITAASPSAAVHLLAFDPRIDQLSLSPVCEILAIDLVGGTIVHNCESAAGMSGGALIQGGRIIGSHIGRFAQGKLASAIYSHGHRPIAAEIRRTLVHEYNCASDCGREAMRTTYYPCPNLHNPLKVCAGDRVFEPNTYSACEAARAADCAGKIIKDETGRASADVRREISDLSDDVRRLEDHAGRAVLRITDLRSAANVAHHEFGRINDQLADLSRQTAEASQRLTQVQVRVRELDDALTSAQQIAANASETSALALSEARSAVTHSEELRNLAANAAKQTQAINDAVDAATQNLTKLKDQALDLGRQFEVQHTFAKLGELAQTANSAMTDGLKIVDRANFEASSSAKLEAVITAPWLGSSLAEGDIVSERLGMVAARAHKAYQDVAIGLQKAGSRAADLWHRAINPEKRDRLAEFRDEETRMATIRLLCLRRAEARLGAYRQALKDLAIAEWSQSPESSTLEKLGSARMAFIFHINNLSITIVEIKANHCETRGGSQSSNTGIDTMLGEALTDAEEWHRWIRAAILAKTNS